MAIQGCLHGRAFAEKQCLENGEWFRNEMNVTWTNYIPCSTHQEDLSVLMVYISGYVLSALLLIASIFVFCYFRQLRCTRVILHQHLFLSYIITGLLWTVSYTQLMTRLDVTRNNPLMTRLDVTRNNPLMTRLDVTRNNPLMISLDVTRNNPAWCKVVHVLTQFISLSNYCWMFCEGFFLHTIIVHAFSKEKKLLRICYGIGWGVPVIPTIVYGVVRATDDELDRDCWIPSGWPLWIINGPIAASLIINFLFFLNIMRILLSKIRAFNTSEENQYRRAVKATLIMIPLLGVNNLVLLVRPQMDRVGILVWKVISAFLVAYQGASVALIFCFFNGEVSGDDGDPPEVEPVAEQRARLQRCSGSRSPPTWRQLEIGLVPRRACPAPSQRLRCVHAILRREWSQENSQTLKPHLGHHSETGPKADKTDDGSSFLPDMPCQRGTVGSK
ncbi:calcitonin gene-related peptide type 1 receptor-like [Babylonia areolata]|uniref:calcitonin gene-related peptide type 1 receptor-like n=1 Tax=Babylonia areolata TaxID=304850 RepID=UPI003FD33BC2